MTLAENGYNSQDRVSGKERSRGAGVSTAVRIESQAKKGLEESDSLSWQGMITAVWTDSQAKKGFE